MNINWNYFIIFDAHYFNYISLIIECQCKSIYKCICVNILALFCNKVYLSIYKVIASSSLLLNLVMCGS